MDTETNRSPIRGEETRAALLEAAIEVFGRDGFHASTTKAIAERAGANIALISYHFDGKEGLYVAAVEHIAAQIVTRIGPVAERIRAERAALDERPDVPAGERRRRCFGALCTMLEAFVDVLTSEESSAWAQIIVREQQAPTRAFEVLYAGPMGRTMRLMGELVAAVRGRAAPSAGDRLTAVTLFGQVLVFRTARAAVLRFLGWEDIRPREAARIKQTIRRNAAAVLGVDHE